MNDALYMASEERLRILLVDDDEVDRMAVLRGLERASVQADVEIATDGIEALERLRGATRGEAPQPDILLLDLNMPRLDGFGVLEAIRDDEALARLVVFILTTSENDEDKEAAADRLVAGYLEKRSAGKDFEKLIELLEDYRRAAALSDEERP